MAGADIDKIVDNIISSKKFIPASKMKEVSEKAQGNLFNKYCENIIELIKENAEYGQREVRFLINERYGFTYPLEKYWFDQLEPFFKDLGYDFRIVGQDNNIGIGSKFSQSKIIEITW